MQRKDEGKNADPLRSALFLFGRGNPGRLPSAINIARLRRLSGLLFDNKLLVVVEAFEDVSDVVNWFQATAEAELYNRV